LTHIKAGVPASSINFGMDESLSQRAGWLPIALAPSGCDLEVCVIDHQGVHALVFPCRRAGIDWVNAVSGGLVEVHPTHWRIWRLSAPQ
jgi:hypothetical protein